MIRSYSALDSLNKQALQRIKTSEHPTPKKEESSSPTSVLPPEKANMISNLGYFLPPSITTLYNSLSTFPNTAYNLINSKISYKTYEESYQIIETKIHLLNQLNEANETKSRELIQTIFNQNTIPENDNSLDQHNRLNKLTELLNDHINRKREILCKKLIEQKNLLEKLDKNKLDTIRIYHPLLDSDTVHNLTTSSTPESFFQLHPIKTLTEQDDKKLMQLSKDFDKELMQLSKYKEHEIKYKKIIDQKNLLEKLNKNKLANIHKSLDSDIARNLTTSSTAESFFQLHPIKTLTDQDDKKLMQLSENFDQEIEQQKETLNKILANRKEKEIEPWFRTVHSKNSPHYKQNPTDFKTHQIKSLILNPQETPKEIKQKIKNFIHKPQVSHEPLDLILSIYLTKESIPLKFLPDFKSILQTLDELESYGINTNPLEIVLEKNEEVSPGPSNPIRKIKNTSLVLRQKQIKVQQN